MSASDSSAASGGIGFGGALFILFLGLKLTGYITWSWWWVTSPLWIPMALALALGAVFLLGAAIASRPARGRR